MWASMKSVCAGWWWGGLLLLSTRMGSGAVELMILGWVGGLMDFFRRRAFFPSASRRSHLPIGKWVMFDQARRGGGGQGPRRRPAMPLPLAMAWPSLVFSLIILTIVVPT